MIFSLFSLEFIELLVCAVNFTDWIWEIVKHNQIIFLPLFSVFFWNFHYIYIDILDGIPQILGSLLIFLYSFIFLFPRLNNSTAFSSSLPILSSVVSNLLLSPSIKFFILVILLLLKHRWHTILYWFQLVIKELPMIQ